MAAGSGNSAASVLAQLSEVSNLSSDEQSTKLMITLVLFHLPQPSRCQRVKHRMEIAATPQL